VGIYVGLGGDLTGMMVIAAGHMSRGAVVEFAHLSPYIRFRPSRLMQYDVGLRGSIHGHATERSSNVEWFVGGYGDVLLRWKAVRLGPRVFVGGFSNFEESGIFLVPLTVQLGLEW
jgi:hypothetical protein